MYLTVYSLAIVSHGPTMGTVFAGASGKVFRSSDAGATWIELNTGMLEYANVTSIAISPTGYIFVGTDPPNIFRSTNNGDTWTQLNIDYTTRNGYKIAVSPIGHIFASANPDSILHSTNNGDSWTKGYINFQMGEAYIVINSQGYIFVANSQSGVIRSTNNGDTWNNLSSGLSNRGVLSLALASDGFIYAGTNGSGVFRSSWSTPVEKNHTITSSISLDQNYPNPFFHNTTIQFSLPTSGHVILKVYDMLEKEIETVVSGYREAGKYSVELNADNKPSGIYLCRLTAGKNSVTKTIMFVK